MYSVDTSAWIAAWVKDYPPDVFPKLWGQVFPGLVQGDRLVCSRSVYDELSVGGDDLFKWAKRQKNVLVHEDNADVQMAVASLMRDWPDRRTDFTRRLTGADLFVIGRAICSDAMVVTKEQASGSLEHPKIPDACRQVGVQCISIPEMLRAEGISF